MPPYFSAIRLREWHPIRTKTLLLRKMMSLIRKFFYRPYLRQRLTLLLAGIFISGIIVSGSSLAVMLAYTAQSEVSSKALLLMETMNSVRNYTSTQVKPELKERLTTTFLPEAVPAYSAREVIEHLRTKDAYTSFTYKEATLNPSNPRDQADNFETNIINQFRSSPQKEELQGFRTNPLAPDSELFYIARPIQIKKASCLECHSTPSIAPKSMVELYGEKNGFGWQQGEIVGAQMISVPASKVFKNVRQLFTSIMAITILVFGITILTVNLWLKR